MYCNRTVDCSSSCIPNGVCSGEKKPVYTALLSILILYRSTNYIILLYIILRYDRGGRGATTHGYRTPRECVSTRQQYVAVNWLNARPFLARHKSRRTKARAIRVGLENRRRWQIISRKMRRQHRVHIIILYTCHVHTYYRRVFYGIIIYFIIFAG